MISQPVAVGLVLCAQVIVEEGTRHASLINTFTHWKGTTFPSVSRPFCVVSVLLEGEGDGTIRLTIIREDTAGVIDDVRHSVRFPDRLLEMRALFRVNDCSFPAAGLYFATLSVDGEWVAQRRFHVF